MKVLWVIKARNITDIIIIYASNNTMHCVETECIITEQKINLLNKK
jgi:hypothetical protein